MLKHSDFVPGETVYHHRFGCGVVEEIDAKIAAVRFGKANLVRVLPTFLSREPLAKLTTRERPREPDYSIEPVRASDFNGQDVPPRIEHVAGLMPAHNVTLLSGDGGTGKSLAALQLAAATALSLPWFGLATIGGPALFISAEDELDEVHRRLNDIRAAAGLTFADFDKLHILSLAGEDAILAMPESRSNVIRITPLFRQIETWVRQYRPELVVLDTLADLFAGDENNRAQARQFVSQLRGLALKARTTIVMLAHPSLSGMASGSGTSGSTGWSNSVRARLYLERVLTRDGEKAVEADPDVRVLRLLKANYGRTGSELRVKWQAGVFVPTETPGIGNDIMVTETIRAERVFSTLLARYLAEGRHVSSTPSANFAPSIFAKDPRADGASKAALTRAMNNLFADHIITTEEYGPPARRRQSIIFKQRLEVAE